MAEQGKKENEPFMDCPACRKPVPDVRPDCPNCGIIFAKWIVRQSAAASPESALPVSFGPPKKSSSNSKALMLLGIVAAAGYLGWQHFSRPVGTSASGGSSDVLFPIPVMGKMGFINGAGQEVIKPQFDNVGHFSEGLAWVKVDTKCGYINPQGAFVIQPQYDEAGNFREGNAFVRPAGSDRWEIIDKNGTAMTEAKFRSCLGPLEFSEGRACVQLSEGYAFVDNTGQQVAGPYKLASSFEHGLASVEVSNNGGFGAITPDGQLIIPANTSDKVIRFSDDLAAIEAAGKWGYVNKIGTIEIAPSYDWAGDFHEGVAPVKKAGYYSYIDKTGKVLLNLPPNIDGAESFNEGRAIVHEGIKAGYIDHSGHALTPLLFDEAEPYKDGLAWVMSDRPRLGGYLNKNGQFVWQVNFVAEFFNAIRKN